MPDREIAQLLSKNINYQRIERVIRSEEDSPFGVLGPRVTPDGILFQVYDPFAKNICLRTIPDVKYYPMTEIRDGYFAALIPGNKIPNYTLQVTGDNSQMWERYDPYAFPSMIDAKTETRFADGICYDIFKILGAHPTVWKGVPGTHFAVWAPNARRVSVVGDFNHWDGRICQMNRLPSGIFELFVPGFMPGDLYKYELKAQSYLTYLKADPYAFQAQLRPNSASVVCNLEKYIWHDDSWMRKRRESGVKNSPVSIYEVHLGTFRKPSDGREFFNYRELAPILADYVKRMNYTHVELMPIMEYPLDESFGYETTGYYAPTARYGSPDDFRYFVDYLHREQIGVLMDWTPAQFPKDIFGLSGFDGTDLYENPDPVQATHRHWDTLSFDYRKPQVKNFLIANALFWANAYHLDGLHLAETASMLYLDYRRKEGQWHPNIYGGNENLEAIEFLKHLNSIVHKKVPGFLVIAGDTAGWRGATADLNEEGLGFDFARNTSWSLDLLDYMSLDQESRRAEHNQLTLSTVYCFAENYILSLSHDHVIKNNASLIERMPGDEKEKYANLRLLLGYQMVHPGKKLLFMGQELGEKRRWDPAQYLDWSKMTNPVNAALQTYVIALQELYRKQPALSFDSSVDCFEWINALEEEKNTLVFLRKTEKEEETMLIICNFSNQAYEDFRIGVPFKGRYKEIFNSDAINYGGNGIGNSKTQYAEAIEKDERKNSISVSVAPLSVMIFQCIEPVRKKTEETGTANQPTGTGKNADARADKEKKNNLHPTDLLKSASQVKDDALRTAGQVKDDALRTAGQVKDDALRTAGQVKDDALRTADQVRNETLKNAQDAVEKVKNKINKKA